ncbi:MAG: hypothetical protein JO053_09065 [Acidobacteria bacterium]|nr:hypothetical protein [Acidobacteriota bacterium]
MKRTLSFYRLALFGLAMFVLICHAFAQNPPKFHVGERVQFDNLETGDPGRAEWVPATITNVISVKLSSTQSQITYEVTLDPKPGRLPSVVQVSQRLAEDGPTYSGRPNVIGFVRAAGGGNPGANRAGNPAGGNAGGVHYDRLHVDANNTVLADRAIIDCEPLYHQPPAKGGPPPVELVKQLIRCSPGYEQPSAKGADGATTMDITEFTPTGSHRWDPYNDTAFGGTINSVVYTYKVKFDLKSYYRQHNQLDSGVEQVFSCYIQQPERQWYCGRYQALKDGQRTMILVK